MDNPGIETMGFDDGSWVQIRTVLTRGMRKRLDKIGQQAIPYDKAKEQGVNIENSDDLKAFILSNLDFLSSHLVNDEMLLTGIADWSAAKPITLEKLDEWPDRYIEQILKRLNELWYTSREKMADFFVKR